MSAPAEQQNAPKCLTIDFQGRVGTIVRKNAENENATAFRSNATRFNSPCNRPLAVSLHFLISLPVGLNKRVGVSVEGRGGFTGDIASGERITLKGSPSS